MSSMRNDRLASITSRSYAPTAFDVVPHGEREWLLLIFYLSSIATFCARFHQHFAPRSGLLTCVNGTVELDVEKVTSYDDPAFFIPSLVQMVVNVGVFLGAVYKIHATASKVSLVDGKQLALVFLPWFVLILCWFIASYSNSWYFCQIAIDLFGYGFMLLMWGLRWEKKESNPSSRQHRRIFRRIMAVLHVILFFLVLISISNLIFESSSTLRHIGVAYFASLIEDILIFELLTIVVLYVYHDWVREGQEGHPPSEHKLSEQHAAVNLTYFFLFLFYVTEICTFKGRSVLSDHPTEFSCGGPAGNTLIKSSHSPFAHGTYLGLSIAQMLFNGVCLAVAIYSIVHLRRCSKDKSAGNTIEYHPQYMPLGLGSLCLFIIVILWAAQCKLVKEFVIQLFLDLFGYSFLYLTWGVLQTCKLNRNQSFINAWVLSILAFFHAIFFLLLLVYHFVHEAQGTYEELGLPYIVTVIENIALFEILHMIIHRVDDAWKEYMAQM
eukprot:m.229071 g.229071  ORF g.229071 m.229071 type:complete len:495 (+) comp17654_c0_seq1:93-1577(+)